MKDVFADSRELLSRNRSARSADIRERLLSLADSSVPVEHGEASRVHFALTLASIWIRELRAKLERIETECAR